MDRRTRVDTDRDEETVSEERDMYMFSLEYRSFFDGGSMRKWIQDESIINSNAKTVGTNRRHDNINYL
jgi:hypothetical protein